MTGFGLLGHAENLAGAQRNEVDLVFHSLPIISRMLEKVEGMPDFKVSEGYSAETSGGILTMLEADKAKDFVAECIDEYG